MRWIDNARRSRDRGAMSVEWVGIVALVLIIVGSVILATTRVNLPIATTVSSWVDCMVPGQACGSDGEPDIDRPGTGDPGNGPEIAFDPPDLRNLPEIIDPPGVGPGDGHSGGPQLPGIPGLDGPRGDHEVGDPVNTLSGAFVVSVTDVVAPESATLGHPFSFARTYDSTRTDAGALGQGWRHAYEARIDTADGQVILTAEVGERIVFEEAGGGAFTAPDGVYSTLERVEDGFQLTRKSGDVVVFDDAGRQRSITDRFGYTTELSYSGDELRSVTEASGREYTFSYTDGLLTSITYDDRSVEFSYTDGLLTEATTLDGHATTFTYDDEGRLIESHDAEGHRTVTNTYDAEGRVVHQLDAGGGEWTFTYEGEGLTVFTDPNDATWSHLYRNNLLVAQADPRGNTTMLRYDENSELVGVTDPRGNDSTIRRDSTGNPVAVEGPEGTQFNWRMSYDDEHNLTQVVNPSNHAINFTYDSAGALAAVTDAEGNETRFEFEEDWPGLPAAITDPLGNRTELTHDTMGQLVRVEDADDAVVTMKYDAYGNVEEMVGPLGNAGDDPEADRTLMTYDAMGRLTELIDPIGRTSTLEYDGVGNLVRMENAETELTVEYDERGLVTSVHDTMGQIAAYAYDLLENVTEITDAAGVSQQISYDEAARPVSLTDGAGNTYRYRHDPNGNIVEALTVPAGSDEPDPDATVTISYDALDQPVQIDYGDGAPPMVMEYTPLGQLREIATGHSRERYAWTPNGQLDIYDRDGHFFQHTYDANGNLIEQELPDGSQVVTAYDAANRPVEVSGPDQDLELSYDVAGRITEALENTGGGLSHAYAYDAVGQLLEHTTEGPEGLVAQQLIDYDPAGRPVQVETLVEQYTYAYDERGALLEATRAGASDGEQSNTFSFTYDDAGRRIMEETASEQREFVYDDAGRVSAIEGPAGTIPLAYDAHGNVVSAGEREYEYDHNGYLVGATTPEGHARYDRDVLGRTIASTVNPAEAETSVLERSSVAVPASMAAEAGDVEQHESLWSFSTSDASPTLVTGADGETTRIGTGGATQQTHDDVLRLLPDHFGSTGAAVDDSGAVAESFAYSPFGDVTEAEGDEDALTRFAGQIPDALTGTYQFDGRTYDPDNGMFLHASAAPSGGGQVPSSPLALTGQGHAAVPAEGGADTPEAAAAPAAAPIIALPAIGALFKAIGVGAIIGGVVSTVSQLLTGDFSIGTLLIDMLIGGLSGGLGTFFKVTKILHVFGVYTLIGTITEGIKQFLTEGSVSIMDAILGGVLNGALNGLFKHLEKWIPEDINRFFSDMWDGLPTLSELAATITGAIVVDPIVAVVNYVGRGLEWLWSGPPGLGPGIPHPYLK